ncbi:hypothetical protein ACFSO7_22535 [Bacillus sp. CGMCC 1.16607]|uniref:hypothetical protein n=1 Tax=Bacillus sp. CGMCC 1.16607 TaxID=3351842 RepID=UPI003629B7FD
MKLWGILIFFALILTLQGCGSSNTSISDRKITNSSIPENARIIQSVDEDRILVGATFYKISNQTKLKSTTGKRITTGDLKPGDIITLKDKGYVMESFPAQGGAVKITLHDDSRSTEISKGIRYILNNQQMGDIIDLHFHQLNGDQLTIRFYEWAIHGKKYEATVNLKTMEMKVIEIENEEAKKIKEQQEKMAENRRDATYAGYITKILPNGLRINRIDFTFDSSIYFQNQNQQKLTQQDFKVGTFVKAYYSGKAEGGFPLKSTLYGLERLTNEENPIITNWIRTQTEFIEPVIMDFYIDLDNSYNFKILDLGQSREFLYLVELDLETGGHTIERIPNK